MSRALASLRNMVIGCLALLGALVLLVMVVVVQWHDDSAPGPTPTATSATFTVMPVGTPMSATTEGARKIFIPAIAVAATPNATATQRVANASAIATSNAQQAIALATQTTEAALVVQATREARVEQPPTGLWCGQNSTRYVCVNDFRYTTKIGYDVATTSSRFIAFLIGVKNFDDHSIHVNPYDLTLVMADGSTYGYSVATYSYWDMPLNAVDVTPGNRAMGGMVFYVPNNVAPERVIYAGGLWESEIVIDLTQPPEP